MQEINLEYYYKLHIFFIRQATGGNNLFVNFACKILKFLQSLFGKHLLNIILKNFCLVVLELAREKCFCFGLFVLIVLGLGEWVQAHHFLRDFLLFCAYFIRFFAFYKNVKKLKMI